MYFGKKTLHVLDTSSVHHQEFFTVHTAMVYVIQVCSQEEMSETCRVSFQNTFEKLVHLVGFIVKKMAQINAKYGKLCPSICSHMYLSNY